ncbi:MAG: S9 family peptidase [Gemmatimonadota bacterium]|nr:S9 family peptidase [Gemmatimonadota bacterium]
MHLNRLALAIVLAATPATAQQSATSAPRAFQLADWYRLTTVSAPAISPSGDRVAFTVTTVREAENKRHNEVWVVPTTGGEPQRFTSPSTESSAPRWSPDGRYLFFTSTRTGGKGSAWAIRMDQPSGEATQIEKYPNGSTPSDHRFAVWAEADTAPAPDSAKLKDDPFGKMQPMARPPFDAITKPANAARFDGRQVTDMRYKSNDRGYVPGAKEAKVWHPSQLWIQSFDGSAKKQLSHAAYSHRGAAVSPDGKWVAFLADAELRPDSVVEHERDSLAFLPYDAKRDEAPRNESDVFVMSTDGGTPRRVARWVGSESDLSWSPDSRRIAFVGRPTRVAAARVYIVDAAGGTPDSVLASSFRYEPNGIEWLADGTLAFWSDVGGSSGLFRLDPATTQPTQLLGGRRKMSGFSFDERRKRVAYVATSMTKPTELFVADADGRNERRLTSFNDKLTSEIAFSDAERFTYPSVGGMEIEGWLMKPYGWQAGRKYPMVLYVHGGPHSQYGEGWFDEFQNLAAQGMYVLFTNPRGSSGYGADFTFATRGRWGAEDYEDLMKATDIAAKRADVDSTRMGVTGGSYGGFMTAWITTKTTRFRAAQTDRMISDWTYWYGASDAQGLTEFEFYGKPWDNFAMYDTLSPIRHVTKVRTPTLMVQSEEDFRTPVGNAELWFMALKKQNVPVELVRYPRSTHELSRSGEPWLLVDRLGRLRQWFAYWLQDTRTGTTASR